MNNKVAIVAGSQSDKDLVEKAQKILEEFSVEVSSHFISAHRNPNKIRTFALNAEKNGFGVIIAIAGLAAHLPGVLASMTVLPIIGVPVQNGPFQGEDALLSIAQMPSGIAVATVGIGNATNAALLAVQILSTADHSLRVALQNYRKKFGDDNQ